MKSIKFYKRTALGCTLVILGAGQMFGVSRQTSPSDSVPGQQAPVETPPVEEVDSLAFYDMLDDVVIEAVRPVIKSDGATTTYSVDEDPAAKGQTLIDVLRRVPGVSVDGEGNIKIQGKSDFKIMVNGREEPMFSQNAKEIFKAMPASAVAKLEVITDPGAKYDAEGTGGILNLVTERTQKQNGYNGSFSGSFSSGDYNVGGFATARIDKVTAQINLMYAGNDGLTRVSRNNTETEYLASGERMKELTKNKHSYGFVQGGYKLAWEPNVENLFTSSFNFTLLDVDMNNVRRHTSLEEAAGNLLWETSQMMQGKMKNNSFNADVSYQHNFDELGHLIVASYAFSFGDNALDFTRRYDMMAGLEYPWKTDDSNTTYSRQHTAQIDYTNPFRSDKHKLESGVKGIFRRNSAFGQEKIMMTEGSDWNLNPDQSTDIMQFQDILAAYASYNFTSRQWSARAGVRYENTRMGIHFHDGSESDFQTRLNDVVPNASVTFNYGPASNLRLAYTMRISRPTVDQVNPFVQSFGYNGQCGNPDLSSERLNKISLTWSAFGSLFGGSLGVDYSHVANAIEQIIFTDGLYTMETYRNTGDRQTVGFRGFLNYNIIRDMSLSVNGDLEWKDLKAPAYGLYRCGWGGNVGVNWNWRLQDVANFGAFGGWASRSLNLQGYWGSWRYFGLSVSRDFLKEKNLNLSLNAMNFIKPVTTFKSLTENSDMRMRGRYSNNNWRVGISVTWCFGSLRENIKSTAAELGLDDAGGNSSDNNSQGRTGAIRM